MQVKAIERLTLVSTTGQDVQPGELVELEDWKAERLIAIGAAVTVTAKEAEKIQKAAAKRAEDAAAALAAQHDKETE